MRETMILIRRELRAYFVSPIAYVFGVLFLGVLLYFSTEMLRHDGVANTTSFFSILPLLFLLFLPSLTMRSWAEERKAGTLELLMTFPVTVGQLIAGKFLAAVLFLAVVMLFTLGFPLTIEIYGDVDWTQTIGSYFAAILMAAAYISVGMFWSSMTRDQIVAMLFTLVTLAALFFLGQPAFLAWIESSGVSSWLVAMLGAVSPHKYFSSAARGVLDSRDLVYYACFAGFFLYSNALVLRGRRMKG